MRPRNKYNYRKRGTWKDWMDWFILDFPATHPILFLFFWLGLFFLVITLFPGCSMLSDWFGSDMTQDTGGGDNTINDPWPARLAVVGTWFSNLQGPFWILVYMAVVKPVRNKVTKWLGST